MTGWARKRFWKDATVTETEDGFRVLLDARQVNTPAKAPLVLPTAEMAAAVASEWQAQGDVIDPETMPFTRSANAAIDKVAKQFDEVADLIAEYGGTDLLCYRADAPAGLAGRQADAWDPLLDWAADTFDAPLRPVTGVMFAEQPAASLQRLRQAVFALDPFELTAAHDLVSLSGSLVIGLAAMHGRASPQTLWQASRIDETWQQEQWGVDEEAAAFEAVRAAAFLHAHRFFRMSRPMRNGA